MNRLIDPVKRIARDLVDKKLWPLGVLLLAGLVAVPLMIGGGSSDEAPAPAAVAAVAADSSDAKSLLTVVDQAVTGKDARRGPIADPFYDPPDPPKEATAAASGTPTATAETPKDSGAPAGTGTSDKTTTTQPTQPTQPTIDAVHYRTEVRWSTAKGGKPRPLSRLTPLGGLVEPAALYLGVAKSAGNRAVFLLGPNATSDGDGECVDRACRVIALKSGESQIVTVQPSDGADARRYHLDVVRVKAVATDAAVARTMRVRVHPDGRGVMRAMWQNAATATALGPIQYDRDIGLLVKQAQTTGDAAAPAAAPAG